MASIIVGGEDVVDGSQGCDQHLAGTIERKKSRLTKRRETVGRLSVTEAAAYVPCGVSTLNKLRVMGGGPRFIKIGSRVLYDQVDLDNWIENHKVDSTSQRHAA